MKKNRKQTREKPFSQTKNVSTYRLTKAQIRQTFASLVDSLATNGGTIEITGHGKVVTVMPSYKDYILLAQGPVPLKRKMQLRGSTGFVDDLEAASKYVSKLITESFKETAAEL
jgi:hypothetical protein